MRKKLDLKNQRFGRLQVFSECIRRNGGRIAWICLCDCGGLTEVLTERLRSGKTKSCGCLTRGRVVVRDHVIDRTAPLSSSLLYSVWSGMKARCYNPKNERFQAYGGRNITVCAEWVTDFETFRAWCLSNGYREGLQIDRENNNKGYYPSNCRFVTSEVNNFNRRTVIKSNKSGYCGVFQRRRGEFRAYVRHKKILHHVGTYRTPESAAVARDEFVVHSGWPHKLNFPELRK